MKFIKSTITLFILLFVCNSFAQNRFWIISDTKLFEKPNESSSFYGYFKRGAEIRILDESNPNWTKIQSDNLTIGFVPKKNINDRLNGFDIYSNDDENPIINGNDGYYGGNHLFIIVAGLKGRALPDKASSVKKILTNGEVVSVNYYPLKADEWVNISYGFDSNATYIQRKYLGKRPDFDELIKQFDGLELSKIEERETIAERLVELATNSPKETLKPAFERYLSVVKQLNDTKKIEETKFNLYILSCLSKIDNYEEVSNYIKNSEFIINGKKSTNFILPLNHIINSYGKPSKKEKISDDCGVFLSVMFYYYPSLVLSVDEKDNKVELIEVTITDKNTFSFNSNNSVNFETTEYDFVKKYGKYININFKFPNTYWTYLEDTSISFEFLNGKLFKIKVYNAC